MCRAATLAIVLCTMLSACRSNHDEAAAPAAAISGNVAEQPSLPDDDAGRLVKRAIDSAGGWQAWKQHRDVSFISTLTMFDPRGNALSDTIFLHRMPLHEGFKMRLDSIGMTDEVSFGLDGGKDWMVHDGKIVEEPQRTAFTRFHAVSSAYFFSLPFALAEVPSQLSYLGSERDGDKHLEKLRVGFDETVPVQFDWMIIYFDATSAKIERIHLHSFAPFLEHSLWVDVLDDQRRAGNITVTRRQGFFPADAEGQIVGPVAAEELIEHVDFDRGFSPDLLVCPADARNLTAEIQS